jgi:hypothetical protein
MSRTKKLKRYLLFTGLTDYDMTYWGGWSDFYGSYGTPEEAIGYARDWFHVIDRTTGECVAGEVYDRFADWGPTEQIYTAGETLRMGQELTIRSEDGKVRPWIESDRRKPFAIAAEDMRKGTNIRVDPECRAWKNIRKRSR